MPRTTELSPALKALISQQDGVVTRQQLTDHGFGDNAIQHRVGRSQWTRLLPGVLLTCAGTPTTRQRLIAAWLWAGPSSAIDGANALRWYGLDDVRDAGAVYLVTPQEAGLRSRDWVRVRRACADIRIGAQGHVPYVDPSTAAIVAARACASTNGAIALLSRALQKEIVTLPSLAEARERIGDKWCRDVDVALVAVGVGLRSPAERDWHDLVGTSKVLPTPRWNQWLDLGDDGPVVCVDALLLDAGLVNEVIGKKYHAWGERYDDTNARKERLQAAGLIVCEATPLRIRRHAADVLSKLERTYLRYAGRGMPPGVILLEPPSIARAVP